MASQMNTYLKFGGVSALILVLLGYLAYTGVQDSKSYYVTIKELHKMGDGAYAKRLRVAGNVKPGSDQAHWNARTVCAGGRRPDAFRGLYRHRSST